MRRVLPSRLQRRRAGAWARLVARALGAAGLLAAAAVAAVGHEGLVFLLFLTAAAFVGGAALRARHLARRSGSAVRFHRAIEDSLRSLAAAGWELRHDVRWPEGPGDGHLALIPGGRLAFAIKDCPEEIDDFDLAQTQDFATALSRDGLPYIPVCVGTLVQIPNRTSGANEDGAGSFTERGVLCCTPDALTSELVDAERAFLTSLVDERTHLQLLYSESSAQ